MGARITNHELSGKRAKPFCPLQRIARRQATHAEQGYTLLNARRERSPKATMRRRATKVAGKGAARMAEGKIGSTTGLEADSFGLVENARRRNDDDIEHDDPAA